MMGHLNELITIIDAIPDLQLRAIGKKWVADNCRVIAVKDHIRFPANKALRESDRVEAQMISLCRKMAQYIYTNVDDYAEIRFTKNTPEERTIEFNLCMIRVPDKEK